MRVSLAASLREITGIALTFQADGKWEADYCRLQHEQTVVTVMQQGVGIASVAALRQELGTEPVPIALALAGRGVLLRALSVARDSSPETYAAALASALPGVSLTAFYVQYELLASGVQAALVRREGVDQLLAELHTAGLWVVSLSLGAASVATLLPYLPAALKQQSFQAGDFIVQAAADDSHLARVEYQPAAPTDEVEATTYALGNEQVSAAQLLPYAAALTALTEALEPGAVVPRAGELAREWGYRHWFQRLRLAVPVVILLLLLGNFLASQQLTSAHDQLDARLGNNQQLLENLQQLRQATELKHAFLTSSGWAQPSWNALCADRLVASLPAGLDLLGLDVNPLVDPALAAGKSAEFRQDVVTVRGQCHDAQRFNAWLQVVSKLPWVQAVRDQNFTFDYAGGVGTFTFTLVVKPAILLRP